MTSVPALKRNSKATNTPVNQSALRNDIFFIVALPVCAFSLSLLGGY
jgi:hypothetical protein